MCAAGQCSCMATSPQAPKTAPQDRHSCAPHPQRPSCGLHPPLLASALSPPVVVRHPQGRPAHALVLASARVHGWVARASSVPGLLAAILPPHSSSSPCMHLVAPCRHPAVFSTCISQAPSGSPRSQPELHGLLSEGLRLVALRSPSWIIYPPVPPSRSALLTSAVLRKGRSRLARCAVSFFCAGHRILRLSPSLRPPSALRPRAHHRVIQILSWSLSRRPRLHLHPLAISARDLRQRLQISCAVHFLLGCIKRRSLE
ncbi:hypothetical protein B0H19DRAFT_196631 [Mycena capillaripes]|nr:hypothetical protein B0H19DRAFT_196631 [Mycena capillaripes]